MLYRKWCVRPHSPQSAALIAESTGAGRLLCGVLAARGYDTPASALAMLEGAGPLPDPFLLRDMDRAVRRIHAAIDAEERIAVFGDYDVDGITAAAMLYTYLENAGAQVFYKLPSRSDDDYGLSPALVDAMADRGISLVVTVDNGTTAFEAAQRAAERGVALVITDHHLPGGTLPCVDALVNPCRADDGSGLAQLCGAGVAFMLIAALEGCPAEEMMDEYGDLAAVGTVADVMKLTGHNRTLVKLGLAVLRETARPGLRALIRACGLGDKAIGVENISYGMAPRLNAAGRMDDATAALRLLLAEDEEQAEPLVQSLQEQNAARQRAEQEILEKIEGQMESEPALLRSRVLVIWGEGWHQGVIGIVASRLVDRYAKPAIVISFDGDEGRGSGRSVGGFSLYGAIASCGDILVRYGGHDLAAGFSLRRGQAAELRRRVNAWAAREAPVPDAPELWADAEARPRELTVDEVRGLERLSPCGSGNPLPRFLLRDMRVEAVYPVSEGRHSRLRLRGAEGGDCFFAVMFGTGPQQLAYAAGEAVDVMVSLSVYDGRAGAQVSARILDMRPAGMGEEHVAQSAMFESFFAGWQPPDTQKALLAPTREDTAAVYRLIKGGGDIHYSDLRPAFLRLAEHNTGRVLAALAALEELGLVERLPDGALYRATAAPQKRRLHESLLLQRLA